MPPPDIDAWITAVLAFRKARRIVVFTGAGISAESGIPTFRDDDGFWLRFPPEEFASWRGLLRVAATNPRRLAEFLWHVVDPIARAEPNPGHHALVALQRHRPTTVVTQNVDGLHQAAGSTVVHEIHGSLWDVSDVTTGRVVHRFTRAELHGIAAALRGYIDRESSWLGLLGRLRRLYPWDLRGRHRPRLVLFGDPLAEPDWSGAEGAVQECDLLLTVGTSGMVYPAALLPSEARAAGATVVSIDPQPAEGCWLRGTAGEVLPQLIRDAFQQA